MTSKKQQGVTSDETQVVSKGKRKTDQNELGGIVIGLSKSNSTLTSFQGLGLSAVTNGFQGWPKGLTIGLTGAGHTVRPLGDQVLQALDTAKLEEKLERCKQIRLIHEVMGEEVLREFDRAFKIESIKHLREELLVSKTRPGKLFEMLRTRKNELKPYHPLVTSGRIK